MAILTQPQFDRIRRTAGAQNQYVQMLPDDAIQDHHDQATDDAPSTDLVFAYTMVYVLRELWGLQRADVTRTTDHGDNERRSDVFAQTEKLLNKWEAIAGLGDGSGNMLGVIQVGTLALGLDATEDNRSQWDGSQ